MTATTDVNKLERELSWN